MKNKKAQITMFIIIGIVILIVAGIFISIRSTQQPPPEKIMKQLAEMPVEFQPLNDFVESCISKTAKEGIKKIGFHGGYIDPAKYGLRANAVNPTESNSFLFNPEDPQSTIPYWYYFKSDNECEEGCSCGSEQPRLHKKQGDPNIEKQLEGYIDDALDFCLNNFQEFKSQGFEITTGKPKTTVTIRDNDVLVYTKYKLEAQKGTARFEINEFIKIIPLELKKIYELAESIKTLETNLTYLEKWTIEQLASFGLGLNKNRLPPIADSELSPAKKPVYWIKQKVKDDITNNMLPLYTPFLSIFNTRNYNYDLIGTFYERASLPIISPSGYSYNNLDVTFNYFNWWPIYLDITGRGVSGQIIGPEQASSSFFSFINIKRYNFYYDLSYPVLVDIYSPEAFNGEGLHFYIGFEANVRDNNPLKCEGSGLTEYAPAFGSLFCNINQRCSNITIETIDGKTNKPLSDVSIYYSTGTESCDQGFTEIQNNKALLKTQLPQCVGTACSLNAVKQNYWHYPKTYAVRCDKTGGVCQNEDVLCNGESLKIKMEPYRNNNIVIVKKRMIKQGKKDWIFDNNPQKLLDNEYAFISLEKIKDHPTEEDLVLAGTFYGNKTSMKLYPGLVPGNYKLDIHLFYGLPDYKGRKEILFREVEECDEATVSDLLAAAATGAVTGAIATAPAGGIAAPVGAGIGAAVSVVSTLVLSEKGCVTIPSYTFNDTFVEGGFSANITLTKEMLDNDNLIFYTLSVPDFDSSYNILDIYDLEELGKIDEYSKQYKVPLKPTTSENE
ncbi:hypothetical protein CEE44_04150 [Candidatus Woesearchaeota archaeon B3_Woes]|nr:MAG: hypothetical protein CEE44_04150 [Candidatus Woesearchaeota archaeon B3_Woes]